MEDNVRLQLLISKYLDKSLSEVETAELLRYFNNPVSLSEIERRLGQEYENELGIDEMTEIRQQELLKNLFKHGEQNQDHQIRKIKIWPRIAIAAAITAFVVSMSILFYNLNKGSNDKNQNAYTNAIEPGTRGATLTLANGKKVRLLDAVNGELAKEEGVTISKTASGQLIYEINDRNVGPGRTNTLTTGKGETYQVRLPDGSFVWLNAASVLKYPTSFAKLKYRRVELSGEGYFEIAKDKAHPFIVKTVRQEVEVLGTHFNINAYADEGAIATTLLEGSVKLTAVDNQKVLKRGEQAINHQGQIRVTPANIEAVIDWKNEEFFLDKMDFRAAMRKIARWYNIEVIYQGSVPANLEAGGWIPRNSELSDVLKAIESTGQVNFKIDGRKLYVSK